MEVTPISQQSPNFQSPNCQRTDELGTTSVTKVVEPVPSAHLRWYREVGVILAFYVLYSIVRNQFGSARVSPTAALENALRIVDYERGLGLFFEPRLQQAFVEYPDLMRAWNIFYGTLHFAVTAVVLIWLYKRHPARYSTYRSILGITTGSALVGFAAFPLMPPRLLGDFGSYGGRMQGFEIVDALSIYGGAWSFDSSTMQSVSNQYAAMPSLHFGWSLWVTLAVLPLVSRFWMRSLAVLYPTLTFFAIIITGNHFWLDAAAGGFLVLLARLVTRNLGSGGLAATANAASSHDTRHSDASVGA